MIRSPLRYPGGKSCLSGFFERLIRDNDLTDGHYAEAYCGGAGLAIDLLLREVVRVVHINDADVAIAAFWRAVIGRTDELCEKILSVRLSLAEYDRQKQVMAARLNKNYSDLTLGFATFYLNRVNRSGILNGGIIGGRDQTGPWKMDARFNRAELVQRIRRIAEYSDRIKVYQLDALDFIETVSPKIERRGLLYLDPPYFNKGQYLYLNHYRPDDHAAVAEQVKALKLPWVVSYDNAPEIAKLYRPHHQMRYSLGYSATTYSTGTEIMIVGPGLRVPKVKSPVSLGPMSRQPRRNTARRVA